MFTVLSIIAGLLFGGSEIADAYTTEQGLKLGATEANSISFVQYAVKHPAILYPTKFALSAPYYILPFVFPHFKPWPMPWYGQAIYFGVAIAGTVVSSIVAYTNNETNKSLAAKKAAPAAK